MSRIKESDLSFEALIINIINEARLKFKKPFKGGSSALYGNNNNKAFINNNNKKSKCLSYKDPNLSHSFKKCFTINKELKKAFKKRIRKTYVPYFRRENNNNLKTIKKDKDDGKDGGSFIFVIKLNPNFYSGFYYPAFFIF